ncbi:hypothetical protein ACH3XW_40045 [Acanthocheilonema viteae]
MLHLPIVMQGRDCNVRNYLTLNYLNPINDGSTIIGVTSACTIFAVPDWLIANSNFLNELKLIDSDRRKICYGVSVHILRRKQLIVLFLRQERFAVAVNCIWKFSGKLFFCNPYNSQLLFVYKQRRACTNLIQFELGLSFFCAVSDNMFEKITHVDNKYHTKIIRTKSVSLFLKENSNIVLITNDTSDRAGFYEMNIFDNIYVEQLANNDSKDDVVIGLLESKKYTVTFLEKKLGNASLQQDLSNYITLYQTTANQTKWHCIARFDESNYLDAKRYKKRYLKKFVLMLYKNITESRKRMNIFKEPMIKYGISNDEVRANYNITAAILMIPVLSVLSAAIILMC